jgi:hypothetical protein
MFKENEFYKDTAAVKTGDSLYSIAIFLLLCLRCLTGEKAKNKKQSI